ncbi:orotate phosphoribosyltransferase [Bacillus sp. OV322]|uniref:orotate phosphoribosyltransferase n=1 Tax=Bacillus sp. OV322 TaxID=1882764 RepID=UPI0008DF035D|nr:orotate phosphoribosyltransferase [Bacillus sp. OV322]SFC05804.1 orotate phosphoribosyltransferase [Bacillus sp. OV322]
MKRKIAEHLLDIGAVSLKPHEPFTWSSGIKSPIYCDNRLTMSYPEVRNEIALGLKELILQHFPGTELIAGTATAGIPHAAWVSSLMDLPMCYVRSKAKGHGKQNQIEGKINPGQKAVVVEDLISTGGSSITAVKALQEAGCAVAGVVSIFTYGLSSGIERFEKEQIKTYSLCDYTSLIQAASESGYIEKGDLEKLRQWKKDPADRAWLSV